MCRELVRTRGFAALLSDEVFADVDLELLQVRLPIERRGAVDVESWGITTDSITKSRILGA